MKKQQQKRMLITGGVGFIGVNAAVHFLAKGWQVVIFDNFSRRGVEMNARFLEDAFPGKSKIVRGDVRIDLMLLSQLVEECDVLLHLAAQVAVTTSVTNPRNDFDVNALGTFNILEAVRQSSKRPIILFASTNKVYGGLEHLSVLEGEERYSFGGGLRAVDENQPLDFHSPYGCSKGAADQYVHDYARLYEMRTVVFRQSCIYGQHQFGIEDQGWVAWFMIAGMLGRPVSVYGNGKQVRDLLFVEDLCACYEAAITNIDACSGQVYNVGGGPENSLSLIEFLGILNGELRHKLEYAFAGVRPGDQPIFISDNGKAKVDLGWEPTTGVKDGLHKLHHWLLEHKKQIASFYS